MNEIIYSIIDNIKNNKLLFKSIILLLWILFCTIILYVFFRNKNEWNINCECKDEKVSFTDLLYYSTATIFTVGYGDIIPKTNILKYIVIFKIFISYIILTF
jgi:hypothetical protein